MGKLRSSILELQKMLVENPARQEAVEAALEKEMHNVNSIGGTADEGWNVLLMQLTSKFKKEGTTIEANKSKALKDVVDKSFLSTLKGIEDFRQDLFKACAKFGSVYADGFGVIKADLAKAEESAKTLRAIAVKKKSKWLASAKYKDKIRNYLEIIDSVEAIIVSQKKSVASVKAFDTAWAAKNFPQLKVTMTVQEIAGRASVDTSNKLKAFLSDLGGVNKEIRGLRGEYKGMAGQMASIKKWAEDADELELVEEEAPKKADPSKAAKVLGIKDVDKLKKAMQAQLDGDEKSALKLFAELAKEEKLKDRAEDLVKALAKAGLL